MNKIRDIKRITAEGIEFANGQSLEAELKIVFPDWVAHEFLRGLPISDSEGFVVTDLLMRKPKCPELFAAGDAAAVTVPKLGVIGHQQAEIVGKQIAKDMGRLPAEQADAPLQPVVYCIGDMGANQAFYIRSNSWYGGDDQVLTMGHVPYLLKMQYKNLYYRSKCLGRFPLAQLAAALNDEGVSDRKLPSSGWSGLLHVLRDPEVQHGLVVLGRFFDHLHTAREKH